MNKINLQAILTCAYLMVSVTFISTVACADINRGLVGYWKLDDNSGTSATDSSGNGNTGTLTNGPTWVTGHNSYAVSFDGTDDYINVPDPAGGELDVANLTLSVWIWRNGDNGAFVYIANKGSGSAGQSAYQFSLINNNLGGYLANSSPVSSVGDIDTGYTVPNQIWTHVVMTYDGSNLKFYANGLLVSTTAYAGGIGSSAQPFRIGAYSNGTSDYFKGYIDDVRVYNRALTSGEVYDLYSRGSLVAWWKFDDNSGTSAADSSGNAYTGTLVNTPSWVSARRNYGVSFNGTSQYMTQTLKPSYLSGTLTAWVYPTATHTNSYVFMSSNASINRVYLQWNGSFNCVRGNPAGSITAKASAALNTWHFIACSWDSSTVYAYYNGTFVTSAAYTDSGGTAAAYTIGNQPVCGTGGGCYIPATLDDLRVYDRKLTTAEIRQIYQGSNVKANLDGN